MKNYAHWPAVTYNIGSVVILLCVLLLLLLVFRIVGSIRLRETIAGLQEKYTLSSQMKEERSNFEAAQLDFRRAETFKQWWQAVSTAAESLGFLSLSLPLANRDGTHHKLTWRQEVKTPNMSHEELLKISVPLRDRRTGLSLNLKAEVCKNGSLESAGRRVSLFTRLMEEHDIAVLPGNRRTPRSDSGHIGIQQNDKRR